MDKKDEKILAELLLNSKISFKQLGKKVGVSREVATYRVKKLVEEKIITDFYPVINNEKLGYLRNGCWMQLKIDPIHEKEFFSFLIKHPFITYIGTIVGKWNVAFDILSKDRAHLVKIIQEILNEAGSSVEDYLITNNTAEQEIYPSKILGLKDKTKMNINNSKVKLDSIDKKLLDFISTNSRLDYVTLSSKLNLTANAVKYRIKRMEAIGVIEGYTISIDIAKLGYEFYNLQIKLNANVKEESLKGFIRMHPRTLYFYRYFGQNSWDIDIGIIAKNSKDLREVIMKFRNELGDMIKIQDIYTTLEVLKANIAPKGIFN